MSQPKCSLGLYSSFLIAAQERYSGAALAKAALDMAHDAVSRWLTRFPCAPQELWTHAKPLVERTAGYLVGDDTTLDKRYSRCNELAKPQYSGNEHGLVNGISLVNLLWTNTERFVPVDYRLYQKDKDGKTKNDLFQELLKKAKVRGFSPLYVLMDSWYAGLANLKCIRTQGWKFICGIKANRIVRRNRVPCAISDLGLTEKQVAKVWLPGFGHVLVCKVVATNGDIAYLATNDLSLTDYDELINHYARRWDIEEFHRALKQTTGIEKCYSTQAVSQKAHIFAAFVAFVKLEKNRLDTQVTWYEQKARIPRIAITHYIYATA
jgi:hypothetical protein